MRVKDLFKRTISILCLVGIIFVSNVIFADTQVNCKVEQMASDFTYDELKHLPAYYVYNDGVKRSNLKVRANQKDLNKKDIENVLVSVIEEQNRGVNIVWDKSFVENYLKNDFQLIYSKIQQNELLNYIVEVPIKNDVSLYSSSNSSSKGQTFSVTGYSFLGNELYTLESYASWSWANDKLTDVSISRERVVAHDPIWINGDIVSSSGSYSSDKKTYTHSVEGHIQSIIAGSNSRPYLRYVLTPNRGYVQDRDPGN